MSLLSDRPLFASAHKERAITSDLKDLIYQAFKQANQDGDTEMAEELHAMLEPEGEEPPVESRRRRPARGRLAESSRRPIPKTARQQATHLLMDPMR